jgi:hypothetical protein
VFSLKRAYFTGNSHKHRIIENEERGKIIVENPLEI